MNYQKVTIVAKDQDPDLILDVLSDFGIQSAQIDDPKDVAWIMDHKQEIEWDFIDQSLLEDQTRDPRVVFYLDEEQASLLPPILEALVGRGLIVLQSLADIARFVTVDEVSDAEWENNYRDSFQTLVLSDRFVVVPSWEQEAFEAATYENRTPIFMDPGLAFGTGGHETTAMCAKLLDRVGCEGKKVLDVGTGSGILAIEAALLGASEVLGVDIDETAVSVAAENVAKNGVAEQVRVQPGNLTKGLDFTADVVLGNLVAGLVMALAAYIPNHMSPGGVFISSGILTEQKEEVKACLEQNGLSVTNEMIEGEWCALLATLQ